MLKITVWKKVKNILKHEACPFLLVAPLTHLSHLRPVPKPCKDPLRSLPSFKTLARRSSSVTMTRS